MADKVPGVLPSLPSCPSRADASPTLDKRPAPLRQTTAVKQILNVGEGQRSPASGKFTAGG